MAGIENTESLSVKSFSYSWLVNVKPSFEGLEDSFRTSIDAYGEASFIEMDPKLPPSKRFFTVAKDVNHFDFPISHTPSKEVYADQNLINNGEYLMPLFIKPLKMDTSESMSDHKQVRTSNSFRCASLRRCQRLSKQILEKYFIFLKPVLEKMRRGRGVSRPGNSKIKKAKVHRHKVKNSEYSPANSPCRTSAAYSVDNWRRSSCDSENSIHEAVLHCKRTIGNI